MHFITSNKRLFLAFSLLCLLGVFVLIQMQKKTADKIEIIKKDNVVQKQKTPELDLPVSKVSVVDEVIVVDVPIVDAEITKNEKSVSQDNSPKDNNSLKNLSISELENRKVELSNLDQVNSFLEESSVLPNVALTPLMNKLSEDDTLREEWLNWLKTSEVNDVIHGTELILAALPREDLVSFASESLLTGNKSVLQHTVSALAMQNNLDIVANGLTEGIVNVISNEELPFFTKTGAMKILSEQPEWNDDAQKQLVTQVVADQLLNEDFDIRSAAVNALITLDTNNTSIENEVLAGINNEDMYFRTKSLRNLDWQLELGIQLSPNAVSSIHNRIITELSSDVEFEEAEKERYIKNASYILGSLDLTESQIFEMQQAGLTYVDEREVQEAVEDEQAGASEAEESNAEAEEG